MDRKSNVVTNGHANGSSDGTKGVQANGTSKGQTTNRTGK